MALESKKMLVCLLMAGGAASLADAQTGSFAGTDWGAYQTEGHLNGPFAAEPCFFKLEIHEDQIWWSPKCGEEVQPFWHTSWSAGKWTVSTSGNQLFINLPDANLSKVDLADRFKASIKFDKDTNPCGADMVIQRWNRMFGWYPEATIKLMPIDGFNSYRTHLISTPASGSASTTSTGSRGYQRPPPRQTAAGRDVSTITQQDLDASSLCTMRLMASISFPTASEYTEKALYEEARATPDNLHELPVMPAAGRVGDGQAPRRYKRQ